MDDLHDIEPPERLAPDLKAIWFELLNEIPRGVALRSDALALESLVRITATIRAGDSNPEWLDLYRKARAAFLLPPFRVHDGGGES